MADEWFFKIRSSGKVAGPLSLAQVKALAQAGQLAPEDMVREGSAAPWGPAARIKGLFDAADSNNGSIPVAKLLDETPSKPVAKPVAKPAGKARASAPLVAKALEEPPAKPPPGNAAVMPAGQIPVAAAVPPAPPPPAAGMAPTGPTPRGFAYPPGTPMPPGAAPAGMMAPGMVASPAAASGMASSAAAGKKNAAPGEVKKIRKDNTLVLGVIAVLCVALVLAGVIWVATRPGSGASSAQGPANKSGTGQGAEVKPEEVNIPGMEDLLTGRKTPKPEATPASPAAAPAAGTTAASAGTKPEVPAAKPPATVPAGPRSLTARKGDVTVTIHAATLSIRRLRSARGPVEQQCLALKITLLNGGKRNVRYISWGTNPAGVELEDTTPERNQYSIVRFRAQGASIDTPSLYSNQPMEDVLVFEKPVAGAKSLRLHLPAAAFDEEGMLDFEIPVSMITEEPEEEPGKPAKPGPGGEAEPREPAGPPSGEEPLPPGRGVPEIDRGIDELDRPTAPKPKEQPGAIPGVTAGGGSDDPIDIPGLHDGKEPQAEGQGPKLFQDDPEVMKRNEEFRRQEDQQREAEKRMKQAQRH